MFLNTFIFQIKKKMLSLIKNGMVLSSFRMEVFAPPKPSRIHVKIFIALGKREISNLNIGKTLYRTPLRKLLHTTPISTTSEVLLNKKQIYSLFSNWNTVMQSLELHPLKKIKSNLHCTCGQWQGCQLDQFLIEFKFTNFASPNSSSIFNRVQVQVRQKRPSSASSNSTYHAFIKKSRNTIMIQ